MESNSVFEYSDITQLRYGMKIKLVLDKLRPEEYSCLTCSRMFASVNNLNAHMPTHVKYESFACRYDDESTKHSTPQNSLGDIKEKYQTFDYKYQEQNEACLLYTSDAADE